jgi:hypothetical protein
MKLSFKKKSSHNEDICDVAKCKAPTDIILRYMEIYEDGIIDLCRFHYKQHLEDIDDWDEYYRDKLRRHEEVATDKAVTYEADVITISLEASPTIERKLVKYKLIEEYTKNTGRRFRMTKDQKFRGLDREEAFQEFIK